MGATNIEKPSTYVQILDVAENIVRSRGFNGFSYADVAAEVGVKKATLHHHFATKSDLGLQLIARFTDNVAQALEEISRSNGNASTKLRAYAQIFEGSFHENKMCLCGMLAAEHETLSADMQAAVNSFFESHERWLEQLLESGRSAGELQFNGQAIEHARLIVANLQGALLVSKSLKSLGRMTAIASNLVESYKANPDST